MRRIIGTGMGLVALTASQAMAQSTANPAMPEPAPTTVVITVKPPTVVHKIDRIVYDLKDNPQATTGNVSDILGTLPSVNVDSNGNVSVRGGSVQVLIDGKPSPALRGNNLAATLESMPANTVARVEVVTNPGAEFRTDAATVINIITKKTNGQAPTGDLILNAGPSGRYNGTLSGSVGVGKWTFTGSFNFRQDIRDNLIDGDRTTTANGVETTHLISRMPLSVHFGHTTEDLGVTYAFDDDDTVSLSEEEVVRHRPRHDQDVAAFVDPSDPSSVLSKTETDTDARQFYNDNASSATYKHKGTRDGETLTLQWRHEEDDNLSDTRYFETFDVPVEPEDVYRRRRSERELSDDVNGDYILPLGQDIQFKTGFDVESDRDESLQYGSNIDPATGAETIDPTPGLNSRFLADQTLSAAYVDYEHPLGKWLVEGGLRVENMLTRMRQSRTDGFAETSDLEWSPSLFVSRDLTAKSKIKFTYSHRIDRPDISQLDPLVFQIDAQDEAFGNPNLKPGQTDSFEAGYTYTTKPVTFGATAYMRQLHDTITDDSYYAPGNDTVLISTQENAGHGSTDGVDLSLDWHPTKTIGLSLSSDIFRAAQTAPVDMVEVRQSILTQQSKATVTWSPTTVDSLQLQGQLSGKTLAADGTEQGLSVANLSWSRKLSTRLKLVVNVNDVFKSARFKQEAVTPQFTNISDLKIPGQIFYVGLAYKLGAVAGH